MRNVSLFVPITFDDVNKTPSEAKIEFWGGYFNVTGWSARVIDKAALEVEWHYEKPSYILSALKVISYAALLLPLIVLGLYAKSRAGAAYKFQDIKPLQEEREAEIPEPLPLRMIREKRLEEAKKLVLDDQDTYFERLIPELVKNDPADAWAYMSKFQDVPLFHKLNAIDAMIKKGQPFKEALDTLKPGPDKDRLLLSAFKGYSAAGNVKGQLQILGEPFYSVRIKNNLLKENLLLDTHPDAYLDLLEKNQHADQDELLDTCMSLVSMEEIADRLLKLKTFSPRTASHLREMRASALIRQNDLKKALEVLTPIFSLHAAKKTIPNLIALSIETGNYEAAVELALFDPSPFTLEFIRALTEHLNPDGYKKFYSLASEETLRQVLAEFFKDKELPELAKRFVG